MPATTEKKDKNERFIDPILLHDDKHYLLGFNLTKPLSITKKHRANINTLDGKYELSFERVSVFAYSENECLFAAGDQLYVIAVKEKSIYYALTACRKEMYERFEAAYESLKDIVKAQTILFEMPRNRRNNIFLQMGLIKWREDLEISNLLHLREYEVKLELCKEQMPGNVIELINYYLAGLRGPNMSSIINDFSVIKLANFTYSNEPVKALDIDETTAYLKKYTFLKIEDIEKLALALSQNRDREMRIFLEGYENAGMDEVINAIAELKAMPVQRASCDGLSCAFELVGESPSFKHAEVSVPVRLWNEAKTNRCVIVYEDLSSLGESLEHGSAKAAAKNVVGEKGIFDEYYKTNFPMRHTLIVASGESFLDLNPNVQPLFDLVLHFQMTDGDKCEVIKEHFLDDLTEEKRIVITDEALHLAAQYSDDFGLRRTLDHLMFLISEANINETIDEDFVNEKLSGIVNDANPYIKYKLHSDAYYEAVAKAIEETHKKLLGRNATRKPDYNYLCERLDKLVQLKKNDKCFEYNKGDLISRISKSMFGVEKVAHELDDYFTTCCKLNTKDRLNVLLVGNPGSGKSSFALEAAYAIGCEEVCVIDLSVATVDTLLGGPRRYFGTHVSKIVETWIKNPNFAVIFDEVDKAQPDVLYLLLKVLDNAQVLQEQFLQVDLPLNNIHIFATANSLNIPLPIIDRFRVFNFETSDRIKDGAFDKVIEKMGKAAKDCKLQIDVDPLAKSLILDKYCTSSSVREIESILGRIKEHLVANTVEPDGNEIRIKIDEEAVSEAVAETPHKRGNVDTVPEGVPGCVIGTGITESGIGITFAIESLVFDSDNPTIEVTGLAQKETNEQVKLAVTSINANYNGVLEGKTIHVHFSEGSVKKSGCSAGAAVYTSILSAALGVPVSRGMAITGEIGLHGGINEVGGVELKSAAAARNGCRLIVMPKANLDRISELDKAYLKEKKIELMGITHIDELVELAMPGGPHKKIIQIS